jgi:hypothetical protein
MSLLTLSSLSRIKSVTVVKSEHFVEGFNMSMIRQGVVSRPMMKEKEIWIINQAGHGR